MSETHEQFMRIALEDAAQSGAEGNRAIGSIIVHNGQVVARSGGRPGSSENPMGHAETLVIQQAAQEIGKAGLAECTLYTTLEPCPMCCGTIIANNVPRVIVGGRQAGKDRHWGEYAVERLLSLAAWDTDPAHEFVIGVLHDECVAMLHDWDEKNGYTG
ncbi:MAG: tRNA(adenine34) deaminase [Chloroflexi bacterium]|jgi:tRNA(Arg) A34 adenosine deaminase TadA|nr:MAG: tRNA(adenine34) deaminase [Chloroflexota bacterium]